MEDFKQFECKISTIKPSDFDARWAKWKKEVHDIPNHIDIIEEEITLWGKKIKFFYDSVADTKIFAIMYLRLDSDKPTVAYYHGHMSYIEDPNNDWHCMNLVAGGYSVCAIDMRFQNGRVEDKNEYRFKEYPSACYNIDDLENCYNKRLDQDALKIIDIIKDPKCFKNLENRGVLVAGPSQGGGLSMMVAAMADINILCSLSDVPSDCAIKDRILGRYGKYGVIMDFINDHPELKDKVLENQDYFDVVNMADKIKCPIITSVGSIDNTCPPMFFYQAYKKIPGIKELHVYDGFGHGGFEEKQLPLKIAFADKYCL